MEILAVASTMSYYANSSVYYGDIDEAYHLYNTNYYQMVSVLVGIIKNLSILRIEALE